MTSRTSRLTLMLLLLTGATVQAADFRISIQRHAPCNLFEAGKPVIFQVNTRGDLPENAEAVAVLTDAFGTETARRTVYDLQDGFTVDLGTPGRGYYELEVSVAPARGNDNGSLISIDGMNEREEDAARVSASDRVSLGVMEFVDRSAAEVRGGGYAFGLKWWAGIQRQEEMMDAMVHLGLQWTRIIQKEGLNHPDRLSISQILGDYPMNAVIKVERYPRDLYDADRYGPIEAYEEKYGRGVWTVKALPRKEPYQDYLREMLTHIPEDQKVFEIWNEAWDKMNPEDFAELCQWITEVILEERPDAVIGPNLTGTTGEYEYDNRVIEAGGMKGMNMVALHPYGNAENRIWLRDYQSWIEEKLGREVEIHITEYGSHSTPEGPQARSELEQSRRVVRQGIALYAGGVKSLEPHWAGQEERNPTYHEHWFGFVRRNEQPKPVLLAHANAARMIDGGTFLGDLWFGPKVAAMVFEQKDGKQVLVLWTKDETAPGKGENRSRKEIELSVDAPEVLLTNLMGAEQKLRTENGTLTLTLDESPVYLTGFGPGLLEGISRELREDRWPKEVIPRNERTLPRLAEVPQFDGRFDDWAEAVQVSMENPRVNGNDASGLAYLGWDADYLYFGADVRDNQMKNVAPPNKLYREDSVELFVSTEPRETGGGFGPNDFQFFLTPVTENGPGVVALLVDREGGLIREVDGARYFLGKTPEGWALEIALPWSVLGNYDPKVGAALALDMRLNDADDSHERWKLDPGDSPKFTVTDPTTWSLHTLED